MATGTVFAIGRYHIPLFHGFLAADLLPTDFLEAAEYVTRPECETNPRYKQLVVYACIRQEIEGKFYFLNYRRATQGAEGRLHGLLSLGIGGHVDITDKWEEGTVAEAVAAALGREVQEEIGLAINQTPHKLAGYIYRGDSPVGEVHLGCTFIIHAVDVQPVANEELAEARWSTLEALSWQVSEMEPWSQILYGVLVQRQRDRDVR